MILVFGSINIDLVARVRTIPRPGETVLSPGYDTLFGGKGANQAVAAARALAGTDVAVLMAGRVGRDGFGDAALANLQQNGVQTAHVVRGEEATGCAFITVEEGGENAITVAAGANAAHRAGDYRFGAGDILVLQMEVPLGECLRAALARDAGTRAIWNLAPAPPDLTASDMRAILGAADILVVNEHEAIAAATALGATAPDADAAAAAIAMESDRTVVLTAGARGASAHLADGARVDVAPPPVRAVDTTGAGDTFVGVLAAAVAQGADLPVALRRACLAASYACTVAGAQPGMPDRHTIDRLAGPAD